MIGETATSACPGREAAVVCRAAAALRRGDRYHTASTWELPAGIHPPRPDRSPLLLIGSEPRTTLPPAPRSSQPDVPWHIGRARTRIGGATRISVPAPARPTSGLPFRSRSYATFSPGSASAKPLCSDLSDASRRARAWTSRRSRVFPTRRTSLAGSAPSKTSIPKRATRSVCSSAVLISSSSVSLISTRYPPLVSGLTAATCLTFLPLAWSRPLWVRALIDTGTMVLAAVVSVMCPL